MSNNTNGLGHFFYKFCEWLKNQYLFILKTPNIENEMNIIIEKWLRRTPNNTV